MGRRVGDGDAVKVTVPVSRDIIPGRWYLLDGYVGMAMERVITDAATTSVVALEVANKEYEVGNNNGAGLNEINAADAFALGNDVYFETTTGLFRSVAHGAAAPANSVLVGRVTLAKDANNVIWFVRTNRGS